MLKTGKILIWIYFLLLIFEGAFRKWITPGLSAPLLLVRDPIVFALLWVALTSGRLRMNFYFICFMLIGLVCACVSLFILNTPPFVIYYGLKSNFLHLLLIFIIPCFFTREDVLKIGKIVLLLAPLMALLMALQFSVGKDHVLNAGAGGSIGTQMEGAMGKIRPPGLFSFITGAAQYMGLLSAFILYGFLIEKYYGKKILFIASISLCLCAVVSISRLAIGSIAIVVLMLLPVQLFVGTKAIARILKTCFFLAIIIVIASQFSVFDSGAEAFASRLERTGDAQVGVGGTAGNWLIRFFHETFGGLHVLKKTSFFGEGIGIGTNAAAKFMTGRFDFTLAEGEWPRNLLEMGFILGPIYVMLRILLIFSFLKKSFIALSKKNVLPILLFGSSALTILNGQLGQSTTAGFAGLGGGLAFASMRLAKKRKTKETSSSKKNVLQKTASPIDLSQYTVKKNEVSSSIDWESQMKPLREAENKIEKAKDLATDISFTPSVAHDWKSEIEKLKKQNEEAIAPEDEKIDELADSSEESDGMLTEEEIAQMQEEMLSDDPKDVLDDYVPPPMPNWEKELEELRKKKKP